MSWQSADVVYSQPFWLAALLARCVEPRCVEPQCVTLLCVLPETKLCMICIMIESVLAKVISCGLRTAEWTVHKMSLDTVYAVHMQTTDLSSHIM